MPRASCSRKKNEGPHEQCCILLRLEIKVNPSRISPADLVCDRFDAFVGREDFDFFVRSENKASYLSDRVSESLLPKTSASEEGPSHTFSDFRLTAELILDDMLVLANCLLACIVAL